MSRFFPHTAYAEDQPLPHTILTTHVLYRGFQSGCAVGVLAGISRAVTAHGFRGAISAPTNLQTIVRSAGYGSAVGTILLATALPLRMYGRERIEWQDRSWRLLENRGQLAADDWSTVGMLAGLGTFAVQKPATVSVGWKGVLGRAGLGSLGGVLGYLVWTSVKQSKEEGPRSTI